MKIILINYDFPPNDGIGGRRWAKLAKGLAMSGHDVVVVKAEPLPGGANSPWTADVEHPNISVVELPRAYPMVMQRPVRSLLDRLNYRVARYRLEKTAKGTIYDISLGWTQSLWKTLDQLCQGEDVDWIMATGAPWNMLFDTAQWKKRYGRTKLLVDFRDPWINARNYGMAQLSGSRLQWEKHKQMEVLCAADVVTTPYPYLTQALRDFAPKSPAKFQVLSHFYDRLDLPMPQPNVHSDTLNIVYAGEMYVECDTQLGWLQRHLVQLRTEQPEWFQRVRFDFYSPTNRSDRFAGLENVHFHAPVGKNIFGILQKADGLMLLLTESKKDDLTTKFFEYLPISKPLIAMGASGEVSRFVEAEQLGQVWTTDMNFDQWFSALQTLKESRQNAVLHIEQFELGPTTEKLLALLR